MMSEDHEYNEAGDEAIVTASKSSGVMMKLMGCCGSTEKSL
jgi:ATP-dependent DNA helicase RecQ